MPENVWSNTKAENSSTPEIEGSERVMSTFDDSELILPNDMLPTPKYLI
jgi:hypothetical protein